MNDNVTRLVLTRLTKLFGLPKHVQKGDFDSYCDEYRRSLRGTDDDLLVAAMDKLIDEQQIKTWPLPGVILANVKFIANERKEAKARQTAFGSKPAEEPWHPPTKEERERVQATFDLFKATMEQMKADGKITGKRGKLPPIPWERGQREAWERDHPDDVIENPEIPIPQVRELDQ